jgi:hypothetical protein
MFWNLFQTYLFYFPKRMLQEKEEKEQFQNRKKREKEQRGPSELQQPTYPTETPCYLLLPRTARIRTVPRTPCIDGTALLSLSSL